MQGWIVQGRIVWGRIVQGQIVPVPKKCLYSKYMYRDVLFFAANDIDTRTIQSLNFFLSQCIDIDSLKVAQKYSCRESLLGDERLISISERYPNMFQPDSN